VLTQQPDPSLDRFADHLARLRETIEVTAKISSPSHVGEVLTMSGNLLRRSQALKCDSTLIDKALAKIDPTSIPNYVGTIDAKVVCTRVMRAQDDAFEALLADTPEERLLFTESAMEGLRERDRLASVRAALSWAGQSTKELDAITAEVDRAIASRARMLVGLNARRREELALLDPDAKKESPWFADRVACDALSAVFTGKPVDEAHLASCPACRKDAAAAGHAKKPKHLDARALERLELGTATEAEKKHAERHVDQCNACARAVAALAAVDVNAVETA
jgi:hypothetical protein